MTEIYMSIKKPSSVYLLNIVYYYQLIQNNFRALYFKKR